MNHAPRHKREDEQRDHQHNGSRDQQGQDPNPMGRAAVVGVASGAARAALDWLIDHLAGA